MKCFSEQSPVREGEKEREKRSEVFHTTTRSTGGARLAKRGGEAVGP